MKGHFVWFEWRYKATVLARTHKICLSVKKIVVGSSTFYIAIVVVIFTQNICHKCYAKVVISVFKRFRNTLVFVFHADKTIFFVGFQAKMLQFGSVFCGGKGFFIIKTFDAFRHRIGNHGHAMIANHALRFVACKFPNGQTSAFFVLPNKGIYKINRSFFIYNTVQRVRCAESVPERKNGIICIFRCVVRFKITSTIVAIHVLKHVRLYFGMI